MSTKLKQTAVLAGILFTGLLVLWSSPAAGQNPGVVPNIGRFQSECLRSGIGTFVSPYVSTDEFCLAFAKTVNAGSIEEFSTILENEFNQVFLGSLSGLPPSNATCDTCRETAAQFESAMATNQVARDLQESGDRACADQFSDSNLRAQCDAFIGQIPDLIDFFLANEPPLNLCQDLSYCSAN